MSYDPNAALEFFKLFGKPETVEENEAICIQGHKANRLLLQEDKMYFLVQGKVSIQMAAKEVGKIQAGEIFGELATLIRTMRSATAIAETPCRLVSLSEKQLFAGLKKQPEFSLTLMSLLAKNLREAVSDAKKTLFSSINKNNLQACTVETKVLRELQQQLGDEAVKRVLSHHTIFQEGGTGMLMYVILEGHVVASIGDKIVGRSGPGAVIGELALVDQKQRIAKVVAATNCCLLAIDRQTFLDLVQSQPAFGMSLLRALATRLYLYRTGSASIPPQSFFSDF
jgi:CRP-like cAMP-binding protein